MNRDSLCRWWDVLIYAVLGDLTSPIIARLFRNLADSLVPADRPYAAICSFGFGVVVLIMIVWLLRPRLSHFRYVLRFPPTFMAVPLGGLLAFVLAFVYRGAQPSVAAERIFEHSSDLALASILLVLVLLSLLLVVWLAGKAWLRSHPPKGPAFHAGPSLQSEDLLNLDVKSLFEWAANEAPIGSPSEDMFELDLAAERILASLLRCRRSDSRAAFSQTVAVQGPYGSGKTSLIQLVRSRAQHLRRPRMIFVELSCWGFESTTRAKEYVLTQCVEALHEIIDCTCLRSAPIRYAHALSSAAPGWIASLFDPITSDLAAPNEIARFAPLLRLSETQLVAVIEDTDRNGEGFDPRDIEAMLFHFRSVERMSFILTAGAQVRIDFPKIAERIEFIPRLRNDLVIVLLDRAREYCRRSLPFVDPVQEDDQHPLNRPKKLSIPANTVVTAATVFGMRYIAWPYAIGRLISHPRDLKRLVNSFVHAWEILRGEVDVDELLMVLALRHAASAAFTFLGVHLVDLRLLEAGGMIEVTDERKRILDDLIAGWKTVAADAAFDVEAAGILMTELMPSFSNLSGLKSYTRGKRVQSVARQDGPDYWSRLTSEALNPREIRDQEVLRAIENAHKSRGGLLAMVDRAMESEAFAALLMFFEEDRRFSKDEITTMLSAMHSRMRERRGDSANLDDKVYGFVGHKLKPQFESEETVLKPWLEKELMACFPNNLRLACDLFDFYARRNIYAGDTRSVIHREVERHFARQPGTKFARGLDPSYPYTLYHLLFAYGDYRDQAAEAFLARGEDWQFLVPVVLDGMRNAADIMVPAALAAFFVAPSMPDVADSKAGFRDQLVSDFFGNQVGDFFALAAGYNPALSPLKEKALKDLILAVTAAKDKVLAGEGAIIRRGQAAEVDFGRR